jgi:hypothetical protein
MTITALIIVFGLAGFLVFITAIRCFRRRRVIAGLFGGVSSLALFLIAAAVMFLSANLLTYQRLSAERPAGELRFSRIGAHQFNGILSYPTGEHAAFSLSGDEWQVDARILKWRAFANLVGFDSAYRLERISGRYSRIEDERNLPRTVYPLNPPNRVDLWEVAHRYHSWLPWFDALYGSATYLPMADGASYEIMVSQGGLIARPLNQAAREAIGGWQS